MSDLVGNPEDRFSRVAAHFSFCALGVAVSHQGSFREMFIPNISHTSICADLYAPRFTIRLIREHFYILINDVQTVSYTKIIQLIDLAPEGAILVPLFIRLMNPNDP